jgi:penicillin-binding protein 2
MVRAVAGIANNGVLPIPHTRLSDTALESAKATIPINLDDLKYIKEGMRRVVTEGTAQSLNTSVVKVAAKSGTAQVGLGNTNTNSWIIGFFPYDNPKYAFAILMERGPKVASGNATLVMRRIIDYMGMYTPDYLK